MKSAKGILVAAVVLSLLLACGPATAKGKKMISGVVNINTASAAELTMLPGIGPSKAQAIIDYRKDLPFQKPDDLKDVKGIGEKLFASIQQHVVVSGQTTATVEKPQQPQTKAAPGSAGKAF